MQVTSFHPPTFRNYDHTTPDLEGIGGSETAQIQMATGLAKRGHDVVVYAPTPGGESSVDPNGVRWFDCQKADFTREGIWILNRCPQVADYFPADHPSQKLWLLAEDTHYESMTEERGAKLDRYICLCQSHAWFTAQRFPYLKDKICIGANGVRMELIREIEKDPPVRNPRKMIFASSPDRGLMPLLKMFPRIKEWLGASCELHCFYGFKNIELMIQNSADPTGKLARQKAEIMKAMEQPGVVWHDRVTQPELYREWFSAGLLVSPSQFSETNFITCQEAQAMGAIPVVAPVWAAGEYVHHGVHVWGDTYNDPLTQARFVGEVYRIASNPELQEKIRPEMMKWARGTFAWDRSVDRLEQWMYGFDDYPMYRCQFAFQHKHVEGDILNIGAADDISDLKRRGAVNLDVQEYDLDFGRPNKPDIIGDCRDLPGLVGDQRFASVILGEILEHFDVEVVPEVILKAVACMKPNGKLIITVPDEHRPVDQQHSWARGDEQYVPGVHACHTHPIPRELLQQWLDECGLSPIVFEVIDYGWGVGHGVVAVRGEMVEHG
jgi:glycosyltransferase involved in cell wall biosynthesis